MNRRTFGLAVRLLAVVAAIYAFFSLRSQVANQRSSREVIPVKVVTQSVCGWLTATKSSSNTKEPAPIEQNPRLQEAMDRPGERVAVRNQAECDGLMKLNGSISSSSKGSFTIEFKRAL